MNISSDSQAEPFAYPCKLLSHETAGTNLCSVPLARKCGRSRLARWHMLGMHGGRSSIVSSSALDLSLMATAFVLQRCPAKCPAVIRMCNTAR
eukprot:6181565-Pleurochrysis_carterae.AAC.3